MTNNVMGRIRLQMVGMGLTVGVLFPIYAGLFVNWIPERKVFFGVGCLLAGIIVGLINYRIAYFALYKPISNITGRALDFAEGDLTQECVIKGSDFISALADSLNKIRNNFRESLTNAQQLSDSLSRYIQQLTQAYNESNKAVEEASATVGRISEDSRIQSGEVQKVAQSVEEIISKIKLIGNLNRVVNSSLMEMSQKVDAGHDAAAITKEAFNAFEKKLNNDIQTITRLGQESSKIENFINTINLIAQETTLLSLNAAIESARAGEQGRGFGVVAEHIRKLAINTNEFTSEITKLVSGIQKEIKEIIVNNRQWEDLIERGKANSDNTLEILEEVQAVTSDANTSFDEVSDIIGQVSDVNKKTETQLIQVLHHSQGIVGYAADITASMEGKYGVNESLDQLNSTIAQLKAFIKNYRF